jgi:hypothetical protein
MWEMRPSSAALRARSMCETAKFYAAALATSAGTVILSRGAAA